MNKLYLYIQRKIKILLLRRNHINIPLSTEISINTIDKVGRYTIIEKNVSIQGDVTIGEHVYLNRNVWLNGHIQIDDYTKLGPNVLVWTDGHLYDVNKKIKEQGIIKGCISIGKDCWIGANVTLIGSISIGDGAIVGAGSVVNKNIGENEVWAGNPARFIKMRA